MLAAVCAERSIYVGILSMQDSAQVRRFGSHANGFGFLRLVFASLVIVSHTPEMVDGDRHREILTNIFHTISFGELAVDAFFIISGYLIVGSFLKEPHAWPYLKKRIARIYPAFIVASLFCLFIVAPLGGVRMSEVVARIPASVARMVILESPAVPDGFGTSEPILNGAMWTITYEFRAYIVVLVLGLLGAFRHPRLILALAATALLIFVAVPESSWAALHHAMPEKIERLFGQPDRMLRLMGIFLMGSVFYLWRDRIAFTPLRSGIAAIALLGCLFVPQLAEPAVATCGAYLIFAFASWTGAGFFSRINNRDDISYGIYLYAWPLGMLIFWWWPAMPLVLAGLLTFLTACVAGWLSWHLLEKPVMATIRPARKEKGPEPVLVGPVRLKTGAG